MNMYLLLKSLHLISVISWMVGLLYLPRIFVYHSENKDHKNTSETFKTMEKKLFNYIMIPAMILTWLFGLLYLPRIFVYHAENKDNQNTSEIFKTMEKKLFNYIMMPAMIMTWLFGLLLVSSLGFSVLLELWMQLKVVFVLLLTIYHFYLGRCVKFFLTDQNVKSSKFYRIINEVPTILLIFIVFIVIFKPL